MSKKCMAEVIGTFILVFFGCGAAVIAGADGTTGIGLTGISFAFGLSIIAAAYGIGAISGAHLNPAVSLGALLAGRLPAGEFAAYVIAQLTGAVLACLVLWLILSGQQGYSGLGAYALGANGYGPAYLGGYNLTSALVFEFVMTFLFVTVILGVTQSGAPVGFAGLAIGLTLAGIHLVGIKVTGVSVNPARSFGPALFAGGAALSQLWVFILAPLAGGALAGILHAAGITRAE
ncbi:MIP family channel protein [Pseudogemmobacter faecipullorum]|uniref:MIP family channel protein n=1 Tax=Pseudogemmobacter faecipullorum TaxID=2755041 RepID=A0ABS8CK18_9RHOB|nr:MIP family channel protein [Pseudogemmobacter faecipullorum]MCB5409720.1 MIP family channel protein [Pseudogemmobacter faecipullorum]